jgi:DNA mismatch repair protein MutS
MICTLATNRILVILDEVGRGTSTFDGLAIAQAVVEYIFTTIGARCLFATHYHELTQLQEALPGVVVYQAASKKTSAGIIFLYTIIRGIADGSFGIEVAKLAQLPPAVIKRSSALVDLFAQGGERVIPAITYQKSDRMVAAENSQLKNENAQLMQSQAKGHKIMELLQGVDFEALSPKRAFDLLWELKDL